MWSRSNSQVNHREADSQSSKQWSINRDTYVGVVSATSDVPVNSTAPAKLSSTQQAALPSALSSGFLDVSSVFVRLE